MFRVQDLGLSQTTAQKLAPLAHDKDAAQTDTKCLGFRFEDLGLEV